MKLYVYKIENASGDHVFFSTHENTGQFVRGAFCIGTIAVEPIKSNVESSKE